jgi:hypothetical protein
MFEQKIPDQPIPFSEVLKEERAHIRPAENAAQASAPLSALCISGGGIRSATFALGALQGLAQAGILSSLDYLSTVSGGGYIGSWLTAWKQRRNGISEIVPDLKPSAPFPAKGQPDPIQHLREYNSYLSPVLGLLSADTWTLAATVIRNMFLNWLVLVPLLLFALMIPRIVLSLAKLGDTYTSYGHWLTDLRSVLIYGFPVASGLFFAIGIFNALRYLPGLGGENRSQGHFLKYVLAPLIGAAMFFVALEAWFTGGDVTGASTLTYKQLLAWIGISGGTAWIVYLLIFFKKIRGKPATVVGLTFALLLTIAGTATGAWLLIQFFPYLSWGVYITVAVPLLLVAFGVAVVLFVGLTSKVLNDDDREWLSRAGAWWLLSALGWAAISALVLQVPDWLISLGGWTQSAIAGAGGLGGILTGLGSFSRSKPEPASSEQKPSAMAMLLDIGLKLAAATFILVFLAILALLTNVLLLEAGKAVHKIHPAHGVFITQDWLRHDKVAEFTPPELALAFAFAFFVFGWLMARCININKFSLHAMYRDRLIRAYLGASNDKPEINKFTGFDESDNLKMGQLNPNLRPFHVVNTTLNLVSGKRLAWQQRKAEPFTVSALHSGNSNLGYRPSSAYGGRGGISLGTALSLSGAAASPNMGFYSTPVFGFIMTLLNARLGAWLGNPGPAGASTWRKEGPSSAVDSLVREAFGLTNEECPYVYLSDGGHFENLGLYEMVKRGCKYVFVLDGAADGELKFGDLGNALRKIRIDTKIDIQFQDGWEQSLRDREKRWAVATIGYKAVGMGEDGYLIYIKPLLCGTEPPDLVAYHAINPDFPHQSTANQFFNESQTESYRMLGLHTINEMCEGWQADKGFAALVDRVRNQRVKKAPLVRAAAGQG